MTPYASFRDVFGSLLLALSVLLLPLAASAAATATYHFHDPSPIGTLHVRQPVITWKVWPGNGLRIARVWLAVNGKAVPVAYSQEQRAVVYRCPKPLPVGSYAVTCRIEFDNSQSVERDWRFTVAGTASGGLLPAPDSQQKAAWEIANALRQRIGLPPLRLDERLCAAATAHAAYLERNPWGGHEQRRGDPGFVGEHPAERTAAFGYPGACFENVAQGNPSLSSSLQTLFDAPYHRIAFLQPGSPEFGAGAVGRTVTLTFGQTEGEKIVRSPGDGQDDVPTVWQGGELPDPLRIHGASGTGGSVGYPILLARFTARSSRIKLATATLTTDDGAIVPVYVNTPDNDDMLTNAVVLIPRRPLRPHTTYRVSVNLRAGNGAYTAHRWQFTTGPDSARPHRSARRR